MKMTLDQFMDEYLLPFEVDGINLEDIPCIYDLYTTKMALTESLEEMKVVREKFKFLCWGSKKGVMEIGVPFERLREIFLKEYELTEEELKNTDLCAIMLPKIMLMGHIISQGLGLPEYPSTIQYVRYLFEEREKGITTNG